MRLQRRVCIFFYNLKFKTRAMTANLFNEKYRKIRVFFYQTTAAFCY